jgi:hypothetical protein
MAKRKSVKDKAPALPTLVDYIAQENRTPEALSEVVAALSMQLRMLRMIFLEELPEIKQEMRVLRIKYEAMQCIVGDLRYGKK